MNPPTPVRLAKSVLSSAEVEAVLRVLLEDGYLGMGREVQLFEEELAAFLGVPADWVVCVNSGTAALHLAIEAVTRPGDEVLVQSLTFIASFQAISAARAVPVACEVHPESVTLDLGDASRRLTSRTRALMPVHYAGNPDDLEAIYHFARRYDLRVVEDAAHAFGCLHHNRLIGSFGDVVCFSFDGIKNITSGEGGAVVTGDPHVARWVKDARLLGVERDTEQRFAGRRSWDFEVSRQGYRYHLSNILAAIGRVQLRRLSTEFAPRRRALAGLYRRRLSEMPGLALLETDLGEVIPHLQPIRVLENRRDGLKAFLETHGVESGLHYRPNHLLSLYGGRRERLPASERLYGELLSLPLHPELSETQVEEICNLVRVYLTGQGEKPGL